MPAINICDRPSRCSVEEDQRVFSLHDPGTGNHATIHVEPRKCQKIQVDGKLHEVQPIKCDWCIRDKSSGECVFIELKGNDCLYAAEQILNTIKWFRQNTTPFILHKYAYIVAKSGIPGVHSRKQIAMARLAQRESVFLRCRHTGVELKF